MHTQTERMTMNARDRKEVAELNGKLEGALAVVTEAGERLRELADAEQEKYDNMSEGLQQSEQGQAIETAASALDEAASACEGGEVQGAVDALGNLELA